ncbi:hypothetical protein [Streptococcus gallolyticus]|uniref:hypothetical protein n=1 Tax=Streptococcus gallolyticus TaxID=315405 RepID=UPI00201B2CBA|nr:hypothetical protein [Streptococcus gallolyticus]MCL4890673.1 hypothetical protein [Streptococcus gallolyticus]
MISIYLVILAWLTFPMFVIYDKKKRVRFVTCGLLYYLIDTIKAYFNQKEDNK